MGGYSKMLILNMTYIFVCVFDMRGIQSGPSS